jgi:hypothetical protein
MPHLVECGVYILQYGDDTILFIERLRKSREHGTNSTYFQTTLGALKINFQKKRNHILFWQG